MFIADEQILRAYMRMEESQRQRLWLERLLHPELMKWEKRGAPPPISDTKKFRIEELAKMGFGEEHYQRMLAAEDGSKEELEALAQEHPLWQHFSHIKGFGPYLAGAYIAAVGDINRAPTVSAFWKGMGLDVLPDGTVPRRIRGRKEVDRKIPALPHVTRIGEQIRQQILRSGGKLKEMYDTFREQEDREHPDKAKTFRFKSAERQTQKILYACLWKEHRRAYGLPTPDPYAFAILKHDPSHMLDITQFYDR